MINLVELGKVAGIAGIALGVFFTIYRDVLRKKIFAKLPAAESYRLLRLIIVLTWTVAVLGIAAWWQGSRAAPTRSQAVADWKHASVIMHELAIGLSRNYIISLAGVPPNSIDAFTGKTPFHVDRYGDNCCGELILFYIKDVLAGFSIKRFATPDFDFTLYYPVPDKFTLGKTTYREIADHPHAVKDNYDGGQTSFCYIEFYNFGYAGAHHDYLYSTTLASDFFDPKKYKNRRDMPVHSVLVADSNLFCSALDSKDKNAPVRFTDCLDPWQVACTYFDDMASEWSTDPA